MDGALRIQTIWRLLCCERENCAALFGPPPVTVQHGPSARTETCRREVRMRPSTNIAHANCSLLSLLLLTHKFSATSGVVARLRRAASGRGLARCVPRSGRRRARARSRARARLMAIFAQRRSGRRWCRCSGPGTSCRWSSSRSLLGEWCGSRGRQRCARACERLRRPQVQRCACSSFLAW